MSAEALSRTGALILVNAEHPLAADPPREELTPVDARHPEILLHVRARAMLELLLREVDGAGGIVPVSGYRPLAEQRQIWEDSLAREGRAFTETYVARPGCSEHQTGLAIDLGENRPEIDFIRPAFPDTGVCGAFRRRAADYGFILRYPAGKEAVTGIGHEPWHFRYVGWPHSRIMENRGLVLEEYLDYLRGFSPEEPLRCRAAGRAFEICYSPRPAALEGRLPAGVPCQWSGDNAGGAVLTLWRDAG